MNYNDEETEIDLNEIFYILRRRIIIIIAAVIVFAATAGIVSKYMLKPIYSSTAKLFVLSQSTSITSLADIQIGASLTRDYMELIKSRPVVEKVIANLNLDETYEEMVGNITIGNPPDTRILSITVKDADAGLAKEIVDEFAEVARDSISTIMATTPPNIVERGHLPDASVSPNTKKNVVIAGLLGAILSMLIIIILFFKDDTIKSEEDVERYLGLNTLAIMPLGKSEHKKAIKKKKKR